MRILDWPDALLNLFLRFQAWRWERRRSLTPDIWRVDATFIWLPPFKVPRDCYSFEEMQEVLQECEAAGAIQVDIRRL